MKGARDSLAKHTGATGADVPDDVIAEWRDRLDEMERALVDAGGKIGRQIIDKLAIDHQDWPPESDYPLLKATRYRRFCRKKPKTGEW